MTKVDCNIKRTLLHTPPAAERRRSGERRQRQETCWVSIAACFKLHLGSDFHSTSEYLVGCPCQLARVFIFCLGPWSSSFSGLAHLNLGQGLDCLPRLDYLPTARQWQTCWRPTQPQGRAPERHRCWRCWAAGTVSSPGPRDRAPREQRCRRRRRHLSGDAFHACPCRRLLQRRRRVPQGAAGRRCGAACGWVQPAGPAARTGRCPGVQPEVRPEVHGGIHLKATVEPCPLQTTSSPRATKWAQRRWPASTARYRSCPAHAAPGWIRRKALQQLPAKLLV